MEDLEAHMMVDAESICQARPRSADRPDEEVISAAVGTRLRSRAEQFDWDKLWQTLFPRDAQIPPPGDYPLPRRLGNPV